MKLTRTYRIKNPLGLHARPASKIVKVLQGRKSSVSFSYDNVKVNAKSIMSLLTLAVPPEMEIDVEIQGEDAMETAHDLDGLFQQELEETLL